MEADLLKAYKEAERICRELKEKKNLKIIASVLNRHLGRSKFSPFSLRKLKTPKIREDYRKVISELVGKELFKNVVEATPKVYKVFRKELPGSPEGIVFSPSKALPYPFDTVPLHLVAYNPMWGEHNYEIMITNIVLHEAMHDIFYRERLRVESKIPHDEYMLSEVYANVSNACLSQTWSEGSDRIVNAFLKKKYPCGKKVANELVSLLEDNWYDRDNRKKIANLILNATSVEGLLKSLQK